MSAPGDIWDLRWGPQAHGPPCRTARQRHGRSRITGANSTDGLCCLSPGVKPCRNPPQKAHILETVY